jgi:hypothetical protein
MQFNSNHGSNLQDTIVKARLKEHIWQNLVHHTCCDMIIARGTDPFF